MIIEQIHIVSFGLLTDTTLDFSESVNIIEGRNETGKSTLAAFIKYMLYGFDDSDSKSGIGERQHRVNWNTGTAEGSMTVRVRNRRYLINRSTALVKNGSRSAYKEDCSVVDLETGVPAFGKAPAGEVFFGAPKSLFENTAFVGSMSEADIDSETITDSIENILFSGNENINLRTAGERVGEKMESLLHSSGNGGAIVDLIRKEEELEEKLRRANEDNRLILEKEAELHEVRCARDEFRDKLEKMEEMDECYENVMLIRTFDRLHEVETQAEAKNEEYRAFLDEHTKNGFVPTPEFLKELTAARIENNEAFRDKTEAELRSAQAERSLGITNESAATLAHASELGGEAFLKEKVLKSKKEERRNILMAIFCVLILLAASLPVGIGAEPFRELPFLIPIIAVGLISAVLAAVALIRSVRSHKKMLSLCAEFNAETYDEFIGKLDLIALEREKRDRRNEELSETAAALSATAERYAQTKEVLSGLILRCGEEIPSSDLNTFLRRLEESAEAFLRKKEILLSEKNSLDSAVRELRRTLSGKSEIEIRAQVPPFKRKILGELRHEDFVTGMTELREKIAEREKIIKQSENDLAALKTRVRDPGELLTKIRNLTAKTEKLQADHEAYFRAHAAIRKVSDNLRNEISPRLSSYATKLMDIMTDKKYSELRVGDGMKVTYSLSGGQSHLADFLSGGTRDLAYVAVRMALIDMLFPERPPVVFDESFAHQDDARARSMMQGIRFLYDHSAQQSFVFTCRAREAGIAKELFENAGFFRLFAEDGNDLKEGSR